MMLISGFLVLAVICLHAQVSIFHVKASAEHLHAAVLKSQHIFDILQISARQLNAL